MDVSEFREKGYLQELNRRFLHPLGLALSVTIEEDGTERFGELIDHRDDPEGIVFEEVDREKVNSVYQEQIKRARPRVDALGYVVQSYKELPPEVMGCENLANCVVNFRYFTADAVIHDLTDVFGAASVILEAEKREYYTKTQARTFLPDIYEALVRPL